MLPTYRALVKKEKMESNLCNLFGVIWGQYSPALKTEVLSISGYKDKVTISIQIWDTCQTATTASPPLLIVPPSELHHRQ